MAPGKEYSLLLMQIFIYKFILQTEMQYRHYVLYAYIPILDNAPRGWTLALVDTPGFGEANVGHITALADRLFSTSTAYLYIIDSVILNDALDAKNIKQLYEHDKGDVICLELCY